MEKIGDFARRCQTTIKTLRFYDQMGLLAPGYIDGATGYRYYGAEKTAEMRRISELKEIGFTLEEIKRYCAADDGERSCLMSEKRRALVKLSEDTARKLAMLDNLSASYVKGENEMSTMNQIFENDEGVIGRWEFIATVIKKEHFKPENEYGDDVFYEELYFLPDGEEYWGFSWTKGYLKISFDGGTALPYELNEIDGQTYMFIKHTGFGEYWVLKQTDNQRHSKFSIALNDDIDIPFADDPRVHGTWYGFDYVRRIGDFDITVTNAYTWGLKYVAFSSNGECEWQWDGHEKYKQRWTGGKMLVAYWNDGHITHTTAPAYEIRVMDGVETLFLENKNGDYIWGKRKPGYFVMRRDVPKLPPADIFNTFEDDETMVGRWEFVEDGNENESQLKEIYFLPQGARYWAFSWTKGYIKLSGDGRKALLPYTVKIKNGERFIHVDNKALSGVQPLLIFRQADNKAYTAREIGNWDDISLPFVDDPNVHGVWTFLDIVGEPEKFDPKAVPNPPWRLDRIVFLPDSRVHIWFEKEDPPQKYNFTKGKLLVSREDGGGVAQTYFTRTMDGQDFLFVEWKTGDYIFGGMKPNWFVFRR
jgi:DNA-binding transcriptional MerR regulator